MKKVLLVEDDSAIIDIYQTMLKKAGFDVEVLSSGQEVVKKITNIQSGDDQKPDIMLLDLILPDMNGADVLLQVRKNSATRATKVFILTNQEKNDLQNFDGAKPDKYIIKANITPTQLVELIKQELG
jgi:CheY-like chemotaxis protein